MCHLLEKMSASRFLNTKFYEIFFIIWHFISGIGDGITKSKTSGTYQVMPKVGVERASQTDENVFYKGKEQSKLLAI